MATDDSSEEGDTLAAPVGVVAGVGGEWGSLVKALTLAALLVYAWVLFFDRPAVFGKKGEPSTAGSGMTPAEEKSGTPHARVALPAKHEKLAAISREESAGVPAAANSGAVVPHADGRGEKADSDGRDATDLRGPSGDVQQSDVPVAEGSGGVVPGRGELAGATAEKEDPSPPPAHETPGEERGGLVALAEVPPASSGSLEEPDARVLDRQIASRGVAGQAEGAISDGRGEGVPNGRPTLVVGTVGGGVGDCGAAAVEDATSGAVADTGAGEVEPATAEGRSDTIDSGDSAGSGEVRPETDADRAAIALAPAVFNVGDGELPSGNISSGEVWSTPLPIEGISSGEGGCEILVKE